MVTMLLPVGRMVGGNASEFQKGYKEGDPDNWYIAVAVPKGPETHWSQTPWGKDIWDTGVAKHGKRASNRTFAWKIDDGDSTEPNSKERAPCEREGYPGNWVVHCKNIFNAPGLIDVAAKPLEEGIIKPGCYVEVAVSVSANKSDDKPGVLITHKFICFRGYSAQGEILLGADPADLGFGKSAAPADLVHTPVSSTAARPVTARPAATRPATAGLPPPASSAKPYYPPAISEDLPPPLLDDAEPVRKMAPGCKWTYEQLVKGGYTEDDMIRKGFLLP